MSNVYDFSSREQRYDEASLWIVRLDKQLSPEEAEALQRWMSDDSENAAVLLEMAKLWDKMDALGRLATLFQPPKKQVRRIPVFAVATMASILLAGMALWFVMTRPDPQPFPAPTEYVYQTDVGEHAEVTLSDGTGLILNTNSRITVQYTDSYRLLTLERGEVYVNVAKDKSRPLSVVAGDQVVEAVGTQFNVEITSDQQIELVVLEGRVKVGVHQRSENPAVMQQPKMLAGSTRSLIAGESTLLGSAPEDVRDISPSDVEVKLSWRQGNLIFRGEPLEEAVREVERYTSIEFVFLDQELKKIRVAGLFKAGDVDGLLATLRENFNIVYQYTDERKVLLGKNN